MDEDSDSDDSDEGQDLTEDILQNQGRFYIMMCLIRRMVSKKIDALKRLVRGQNKTQPLVNPELNYFYSSLNENNKFQRVLDIFLKSIPLIVYHCLDKHRKVQQNSFPKRNTLILYQNPNYLNINAEITDENNTHTDKKEVIVENMEFDDQECDYTKLDETIPDYEGGSDEENNFTIR